MGYGSAKDSSSSTPATPSSPSKRNARTYSDADEMDVENDEDDELKEVRFDEKERGWLLFLVLTQPFGRRLAPLPLFAPPP